jgi:HD-like signal output (HDOD) protein
MATCETTSSTEIDMPELLAKASRPWALRLLPPFPDVTNRVLAMVNNEDVGARQISEVINLDPTFAAEILRCQFSPVWSGARDLDRQARR